MSKERQIDIILNEIDQAYTIPTYMEKRVREGIQKALEKIEKGEQHEQTDLHC